MAMELRKPLTKVWDLDGIPNGCNWRRHVLVGILKLGDKKTIGNHRTDFHLGRRSKVCSSVLKRKLQNGFRRSCSCRDAIFALRCIIGYLTKE